MAGLIEVKFDERKLKNIERMFKDIPNAMPKIMSRGINKTAVAARTETSRRIAAEIKIKISAVRKAIDFSKASYTKWQAELVINEKRIPLINFGAKQTKKGVTYQIDKRSGRKLIASAFLATLKSGHEGVFIRKGKARLPIRELKGPSLGVVFDQAAGLAKRITLLAYQKLEKNIDVQVALILRRYRRAA